MKEVITVQTFDVAFIAFRIIINKEDDSGLTKAVTGSLSQILPASWGTCGGEILPDSNQMLQVLGDHPDLASAYEQMTSVWISGRKVDTVYSGLESQGLCTIQGQVSGGRLVVLAAVDELLSFFSIRQQMPENGIGYVWKATFQRFAGHVRNAEPFRSASPQR